MSETEVHALDPAFAARWPRLPPAVTEAEWLAWVEAAGPELDEDRDELLAAAPREGALRRTAGDGHDLVERVLLRAMLAEVGRDRWDGPGGRMFWSLAEAVAAPEDEALAAAWAALLSVVDPGAERPGPEPRPAWLDRAYEDALWKGLLPPAAVAELAARLDAPGVLDGLVLACVDAGQEEEGRALGPLAAFLQRAAAEGRWVLGLEWST